MTLFTSIPAMILLLSVVALHALGRFTNGILSRILKYISIALHIPACIFLIYLKAPLEEGVLFYMISLFAYLLAYCIKYRLDKGKGEGE